MIWQSRTIEETPSGDWRATDDDRVLVSGLTEEQAKKYQAGELDYCNGCMHLSPPFVGEHCSDCEAYCRKYYGACSACHETAHTKDIEGKPFCMECAKHKGNW